MPEINKIRRHSSGTAYINIPKNVMKRKGFKEGDYVSFLYPKKDSTIIISKLDEVGFDD